MSEIHFPGKVLKPLKWAPIGGEGGFIGPHHWDAMERLSPDLFQLIAGCPNTDEEVARVWGERKSLHPSMVFTDYRQLLFIVKAHGLDVVDISTPTGLHAEMINAAIDARVPVIVTDKPAFQDMQEAATVARAFVDAKKAGWIGDVFVTYNHAMFSAVIHAAELIRDYMAGGYKVVNASGYFKQAWSDRNLQEGEGGFEGQKWRREHPLFVVLDLLTHVEHMMRVILKQHPTDVTTLNLSTNVPDRIGADFAKVDVKFPLCKSVTMLASNVLGGYRDEIGFEVSLLDTKLTGSSVPSVTIKWELSRPDVLILQNKNGVHELFRGQNFGTMADDEGVFSPAGHSGGWSESWVHWYMGLAYAVYLILGIAPKDIPEVLRNIGSPPNILDAIWSAGFTDAVVRSHNGLRIPIDVREVIRKGLEAKGTSLEEIASF
jgi:predicted dehydrogenase